MQEWANVMLSGAREDEEINDSASSIYSENFEFRFEGLKKQNSREIDQDSSVMSMIENFEKLQNTSCAESIFDDINKSKGKNQIKYQTEARIKEGDFDNMDEDLNNKGQTNVSTRKDTDASKNNSRAEILVNLRFR
jgi:hypothetical protein